MFLGRGGPAPAALVTPGIVRVARPSLNKCLVQAPRSDAALRNQVSTRLTGSTVVPFARGIHPPANGPVYPLDNRGPDKCLAARFFRGRGPGTPDRARK